MSLNQELHCLARTSICYWQVSHDETGRKSSKLLRVVLLDLRSSCLSTGCCRPASLAAALLACSQPWLGRDVFAIPHQSLGSPAEWSAPRRIEINGVEDAVKLAVCSWIKFCCTIFVTLGSQWGHRLKNLLSKGQEVLDTLTLERTGGPWLLHLSLEETSCWEPGGVPQNPSIKTWKTSTRTKDGFCTAHVWACVRVIFMLKSVLSKANITDLDLGLPSTAKRSRNLVPFARGEYARPIGAYVRGHSANPAVSTVPRPTVPCLPSPIPHSCYGCAWQQGDTTKPICLGTCNATN